ncbi:DNA polymerase I [Mesoplasma photuris]|uniref:DNA polymerase I n=1 Tax=Mesoplasma photuris TaxID=217731 RepID=UPI0004E13BE6|nr:DNA polymerase I [Mesoplasma photuris]
MGSKKILLVDGNSLLFRAYFAGAYKGNILRTSTGIPTNAIYSFANMLTSLLDRRDYYDVKVAFDAGKKTFRHDMLEDYKAGRSETPEDLIPQFAMVREFLDAAGIDWYELENIEADDIIGSLSKYIETNLGTDYEIEILTSDKDMFQLISDQTKILLPISGTSDLKEYSFDELFEKWKCTPTQVCDLKGLMGDPSDNLRGVEGVGEKTAIKLVTEYGTIESIYENIENIKGTLKNKLEVGKESAYLCKKIATISTDIHIDNLKFRPLNISVYPLIEFLKKYEMYSLVKRLSTRAEGINSEEIIKYKILKKWDRSLECLENSIYIQTLDENYHTSKIVGYGISNDNGNFFIDVKPAQQQLSIFNTEIISSFDDALSEFLKDETKLKNTYDIKATLTLLKNSGYDFSIKSFVYDMMIAGYTIDANVKSNISSHTRVISPDLNIIEDEFIFGRGVKKNSEIDIDKKAEFISKKAFIINKTKQNAIERMIKTEQFDLYNLIDLPFAFVLFEMEQNGINIDKKELKAQTIYILAKLNEVESEMKEMIKDFVGESFNFQSPKQIQELLFIKLGLKDLAKGSTGKDVLDKLKNDHPIIPLLLKHRKFSKLYSTYLRGFEKYIFKDGKIHTIFNQTLTNTGRLSSSEPNVQNISVHDNDQKQVRKIFVTEKDYKFYSFDYSQIELRVLAQMGNEKSLIDIFIEDRDVHAEAARKIFNLDQNEIVDEDKRRIAKVFNFGIIYGLSDYGLAQDLNISIPEAKIFIEAYYKSFPDILAFKNEMIANANSTNYASTLVNRKRLIDELKSTKYLLRQFGERVAVNMPIQGTAADILKVAMININNYLRTNNLKSKMIAQVHDEIIFEIHKDENDHIVKIKALMNDALISMFKQFNIEQEVKVKLKVSESSGNNWFELK